MNIEDISLIIVSPDPEYSKLLMFTHADIHILIEAANNNDNKETAFTFIPDEDKLYNYSDTIIKLFIKEFILELVLDLDMYDFIIVSLDNIKIFANKFMIHKQTITNDHKKSKVTFNLCPKCSKNSNSKISKCINFQTIKSKEKSKGTLLCHKCACNSKRFKEDKMFRELVLGANFLLI